MLLARLLSLSLIPAVIVTDNEDISSLLLLLSMVLYSKNTAASWILVWSVFNLGIFLFPHSTWHLSQVLFLCIAYML